MPAPAFGTNRFKTISSSVEAMLDGDQRARDDDTYLILKYWREVDGIKISDELMEQIIKKATAHETIRRERQALQERGKHPASPDVQRARFRKAEDYRRRFAQ